MSYSFVGVNGDGAAFIVNGEDGLPQPPATSPSQLETMSTMSPFSSILLNPLASFSSSFGTFSTITTAPGFSTFSTGPSWNPYAPAPDLPPPEPEPITINKKRPYFEPTTTTSLATAAARKKRKQNFFEEEEATCAKCHYRRKCMKCINCFARFCEQRCLPRYLEDPAAQEEVKQTNTWLCPCCKGTEPQGKYKGSDMLRKDSEETKEKEEDDDDAKPTTLASISHQIIPQQSPIQAQPTQQHSYYMDNQPVQHHQNPSFSSPHHMNPYIQQQQQQQQQAQAQFQLQQQQQQQQQMIKLQLQQQQQLQLHQLQQQQQQLQQQHQQMQQSQFQQNQFSPAPLQYAPQQFQSPHQGIPQAHLQQAQRQPGLPPQPAHAHVQQVQTPKKEGEEDGKKGSKGASSNGVPTPLPNGGIALPGEGDPNEYPKETEDFCAVCGDIYSYDDNNEIIYCDGCNVAVHQACYGVSKIPAGEWLCDRCKAHVLPACYLCSQKGGAMKEILDKPNHWVHLTCVATLFELRPLDYSNKIGPPGILDKIDKKRYQLKCTHCKENNKKDVTGPLIQCKSKRCTLAYHPICCQKKLSYDKELGIFVTYCPKHASEAPHN